MSKLMRNGLVLPLMIAFGLAACSRSAAPPPAPSGSGTPNSADHQNNAAQEHYTCAMHPQVKSSKPGKCPICHMDLIKAQAPADKPKSSPDEAKGAGDRIVKFYRHPMDPSIHSKVPAKDNMGMDYIPVYEEPTGQAQGENSPQVQGRGSITLTPQQDALTGSKPIRVEVRVLKREIEAPGRVTSPGRVSFQIFEQDFALIQVGQSFLASSPSMPGERITGRIVGVAQILDPMTRTVRTEGSLSGAAASRLRVESTVTGNIQVETARVVAIPESAVIHTGTQDIVFVTDGKGAYQPRPVTLGIKAQGFFEITDGLKEGTLISSGPNFLLDSESRIRASYDQ